MVAWDDSTICELTHPPLTAVGHDIVEHGATVARALFDVIDGASPTKLLASTPSLVVRGTTGRPKRRR